MSLFKTCNWWSTRCSLNNEELFDQQSLISSNFNNSDVEMLIIGAHNGHLWVYKPRSDKLNNGNQPGFTANDLLIEVQLPYPILQIKTGKLVSGSQNIYIAVLHPKFVIVYNLILQQGLAEYGDQSQLQLIYEHQFKRTAANMVVGPFGAVQNRDFICVQSLDGVLTFYEQEVFSFCCFLPDFLLSGPIEYISRTDCFVTVGSDWNICCYNYRYLSEAGVHLDKNVTDGKKIIADWIYNLSESANSIVSLMYSCLESYVVILGEKNIYCLNDAGKLKFMKKLEYTPLCFYPYLLEPENKLMLLIVTDSKTLLIYENTTLRWSAQLDFLPIAIIRGNFENLQGGLVLLSEEGDLQCCYLGTNPSQYIIPPLVNVDLDYETVEEELASLQKIIKSHNNSNDIILVNAAAERELIIVVHLESDMRACLYKTNVVLEDTMTTLPSCRLTVELVPNSPFEEVQVSITVQSPLRAEPSVHFHNNLSKRTASTSDVFLYDGCNIVSLNAEIVVSYVTSSGVPRILMKNVCLPLKLVAQACAPVKEVEHKITINTNKSSVPLSQLFSEFVNENGLTISNSAIGLKTYSTNTVVTIVAAKSSQRYRLQSENAATLTCLVQELINRLRKHFAKTDDLVVSYNSSLPINQLNSEIDNHFKIRNEVKILQEELARYTTQFRVIQKRLISKFKDKNPTPLTYLKLLIQDTYSNIIDKAQQFEEKKGQLAIADIQLKCLVNLIISLVELTNPPAEAFKELKSALLSANQNNEDQGWEEVTELSLNYMIRTSLQKSEKDKLRSSEITAVPITDVTKLKKHISIVLERLTNNVELLKINDIAEDERELDVDFEVEESSEKNSIIPIGSRLAEVRSARKPMTGRSTAPVLLKARKNQHKKQDEQLFV